MWGHGSYQTETSKFICSANQLTGENRPKMS